MNNPRLFVRIVLMLACAALLALPAAAQTRAPGAFELVGPTGQTLIRDLPSDLAAFTWTPSATATDYTLRVFYTSGNVPSEPVLKEGAVLRLGELFSATGTAGSLCTVSLCTYAPNGPTYDLFEPGTYFWTVTATDGVTTVEATNGPYAFGYSNSDIPLMFNGNFELGSYGFWNLFTASGDKVKAGSGVDGSYAFLFKGSAAENSALSYSIKPKFYAVDANDSLKLSWQYWAKGAVNARVNLKIKYVSGTPAPTNLNYPLSVQSPWFTETHTVVVQGGVKKVLVAIRNQSTGGKIHIDNVTLDLLGAP